MSNRFLDEAAASKESQLIHFMACLQDFLRYRLSSCFLMSGTHLLDPPLLHTESHWFQGVDFVRLNRRLNNKTFTVVRLVAISGRRNVGDEYFNRHEHLNFTEMDIISIGPVIEQATVSFAACRGSHWVVPIDVSRLYM